MSKFDLILPRGKEQVLKAEDKDYDRGLLVELLSDGGYEVAYWYDKEEPYPIEVLVDGESVKKDAKKVTFKFHPKMEEKRVNESQEIMGSFIDYLQEKRDGKSAKDKGYSLRDWFKGGGWKQAGGKYDGKPCAKQPGQKTKPYCRDADDRAKLSKKERNKRAAKKRREDPNPNRKGKAKMVKQESYSGTELNRLVEDKKKSKKDACYHKVKSRYKVWPSAYASGALVKCRKVGAKNWGNSTKKESYNFKSFAEFLTS